MLFLIYSKHISALGHKANSLCLMQTSGVFKWYSWNTFYWVVKKTWYGTSWIDLCLQQYVCYVVLRLANPNPFQNEVMFLILWVILSCHITAYLGNHNRSQLNTLDWPYSKLGMLRQDPKGMFLPLRFLLVVYTHTIHDRKTSIFSFCYLNLCVE